MNAKAPFELVNRLLRKKDVQTVIDTVYRYCGQKESVIFCDQIMGLGFREAFRPGFPSARTTWSFRTANGPSSTR
jgi:DNA-directed RNA polymerase subunit beta'